MRVQLVACLALFLCLGCSSDSANAPAELTTDEEIARNYENRALRDLFGGREIPAVQPGTLDEKTKTTLRERGEYLVRGPAACGACHGADPGKPESPLSGGRQFQDRFGSVYAANITPDEITGIGGWKLPEIMRAIRAAQDRNNKPLSIDLHSTYRWMSDGDAKAIAVYLQSLEPVESQVERRELGTFDKKKWGIFPVYRDVEGYVTSPPRAVSAPYGRYLSYHVAGCYSCHTPEGGVVEDAAPFSGADNKSKGLVSSFKTLFSLLIPKSSEERDKENEKSLSLLSPEGQEQYLGKQVGAVAELPVEEINPVDAAVGANPKYDEAFQQGRLPVSGPDIRGTSESGLINWSRQDLVRYLSTGKTPAGETRDGRVCPWPHFQRMSEADKEAIAMFLKQQ